MQISVFGLGYVGCVSVGCLAKKGHTVIGVDVNETKVNQVNKGLPTIIEKDIDVIIQEEHLKQKIRATTDYRDAIMNSEVSIIAVGTPTGQNGHLDLTYIFGLAERFGNILKLKDDFHIILIRSTVLPGTIKKFTAIVGEVSGKVPGKDFHVACNPEFLREGSAVHDYFHPPYTLIGSDHPAAAEKISSIYKNIDAQVFITEIEVAEIMKYINNTFHALKIAFANEVGNICAALQLDSHKVMEIFCNDTALNISPYYLKPGFAYGGSCLPKDLKALQTLAHDLYVKVPVIENIDKTNELQISRALDIILHTGKKKIAVLGLSFKAGTDDLRNSPAVTLVETLIGKGFEVKIFDKNIQLSRLTGTNKEYIDKHIPHLSKLMVDRLSELVDETELVVVNNREKEYVDVLLETESPATIVDMVRLPEPIRERSNYIGINW